MSYLRAFSLRKLAHPTQLRRKTSFVVNVWILPLNFFRLFILNFVVSGSRRRSNGVISIPSNFDRRDFGKSIISRFYECWKYCGIYMRLLHNNQKTSRRQILQYKYNENNKMQTIVFFESSPDISLSTRRDTPRLVLTDWGIVLKEETTFLLSSITT